ncbi:MAG: hypothetical protein JWM67_1103, partial [Mycobacterium sp.]|nr:hypothetical protein [Mycobacterium sp.]
MFRMTPVDPRRLGAALRARGDGEAGFTLIEQMVALLIFSVLSMSLLAGT